jgi:hypothetical protein
MDSPTIQTPPAIGPEPHLWGELLSLPWRRYEILSHMQPAEALAAIARVTAPGRSLWRHPLSRPVADFEGAVGPDGFAINRVIRYRNSFLPMIKGRLEAAPVGTLITISMRPLWLVTIFWLFWMTFVAVFLAAMLLAKIGVQNRSVGILVGAGMLAFGYLVCSIGFGLEARWAKQMLEKLLSGRS